MTEEKRVAEMDEETRAEYERKKEQDAITLMKYRQKLEAIRKVYSQGTEAVSEGGRRNRALSLGECCLQAIDQLQKLNGTHRLIPGTLFWNLDEEHITLENGKKGYRHSVVYHVKADEPALSQAEIDEEVEETRKRIEQETGEMFGYEADGRDPEGPAEAAAEAPAEGGTDGGGNPEEGGADPERGPAPWD